MSFASSLTSNLRRVPAEREPAPGFGRTAIVAHVDRWFATAGPEAGLRAALVVIDVDIDDALPYDVPGDAITAYAGRDDDGDDVTSAPAGGGATTVTSAPAGDGAAVMSAPAADGAAPAMSTPAGNGAAPVMVTPAGDGAAPVMSIPAAERGAPYDPADRSPSGEGDATEARRRRLGRSVERAVSAQVRPGDAVARIDAGRFAVLRNVLAEDGSARTEAAALARGVEDGLVGRPEGYGVRVTAGAATLRSGAARGGQETLGTVTTAMLEGKLLTDDRVVVVVAPGG